MRTDESNVDLCIKSYDHTFVKCSMCDSPAGYALLAEDSTAELEAPVCEHHAAKLSTMVEYDSK